MTVVLAAGDYPDGRDSGTPIHGIEAAEATGALVFHAGTATHGGELVTNGGRILNVTGLGADVAEARRARLRRRRAHLVRQMPATAPTSPRRQPVSDSPLVGILVGSDSDVARMQPAIDELDRTRDRARVRGALGAPRAEGRRRVLRDRRRAAGSRC